MATSSVSPSPLLPPNLNFHKYKVALCQLPVSPKKSENIARARARVDAAAAAGAKLVVLPEIWCCPYSMETLPSYAEDIDGGASPSVSMMSEIAAARKITIVGGSIPEKAHGKVFNTCCVIGPDGKIMARHRKLHLFEIDIPGDISLKESDVFTAGPEPTVVDTDVGRIGIGICHDIRFPELAMLYRSREPISIMTYPTRCTLDMLSFCVQHEHWGTPLGPYAEIQLAVDNQLFVATCSPARDPNAKSDYMIWGHSSLIGPFGEVLATAGHEEATVIGEVDLSMIQSTRENLPLETQSRGDLYQFIDFQRGSERDVARGGMQMET
ncbi:hypothetical protein ACP4OV_016901 [Aristida adscensionis]